MNTILEVKNLRTSFKQRKSKIHAVNGVSFSLKKGEILGLVGESGCGKSVTMLSILNLLPPTATIENGQIFFNGQDIRKMNKSDMQHIRGNKIAIIFQEAMTSLNPLTKIGAQISEALIYHKKLSKFQALERSTELLELVGFSNAREVLNEYPHQLSGGMQQRVMISMALSCDPQVLICDEATTALDVTVQAQIVELIKSIHAKLNTSIIFITHDLGLIAGVADRVIVMYSGFIVEEAMVDDLYDDPRHPYTIGLLKSIPKIRGQEIRRLESIKGYPPDLLKEPQFCPFAPRCGYSVERCWKENPILKIVPKKDDNPTHKVACWVDTRNGVKK